MPPEVSWMIVIRCEELYGWHAYCHPPIEKTLRAMNDKFRTSLLHRSHKVLSYCTLDRQLSHFYTPLIFRSWDESLKPPCTPRWSCVIVTIRENFILKAWIATEDRDCVIREIWFVTITLLFPEQCISFSCRTGCGAQPARMLDERCRSTVVVACWQGWGENVRNKISQWESAYVIGCKCLGNRSCCIKIQRWGNESRLVQESTEKTTTLVVVMKDEILRKKDLSREKNKLSFA